MTRSIKNVLIIGIILLVLGHCFNIITISIFGELGLYILLAMISASFFGVLFLLHDYSERNVDFDILNSVEDSKKQLSKYKDRMKKQYNKTELIINTQKTKSRVLVIPLKKNYHFNVAKDSLKPVNTERSK